MSAFVNLEGVILLPIDRLVAVVVHVGEPKGWCVCVYHTIPGMDNPLKIPTKDEDSVERRFQILEAAMKTGRAAQEQKKTE